MKKRWVVALVVGASFAANVVSAPPAAAAGVGAGQFSCHGRMTWPVIFGGYTECYGTASDFWTDGEFSRSCVSCDFVFAANYSTTCIPPLPPALAFFQGTMSIAARDYDFKAVMVGATLVFSPPEVTGSAVMVMPPPFVTCGGAALKDYDLVGAFTPSV